MGGIFFMTLKAEAPKMIDDFRKQLLAIQKLVDSAGGALAQIEADDRADHIGEQSLVQLEQLTPKLVEAVALLKKIKAELQRRKYPTDRQA
jgi:hypothetical protein